MALSDQAQALLEDRPTTFEAEVNQLIGSLHAPPPQRNGTLVRLVGMRLETRGLMAPLGACCGTKHRHALLVRGGWLPKQNPQKD